jgi:magnesium transporter
MLQAYPDQGDCRISPQALLAHGAEGHTWLDLQDPTPEEIAAVEKATGVSIPSRESLEEIEVSSRLRLEGKTIVMSTPLIARDGEGAMITAPVGFLLNAQMCVTVRFADFKVFDTVKSELQGVAPAPACDIFVRLLEEVVDRAADQLETSADQLDKASHAIFHLDEGGRGHKLTRDTALLRRVMTEIGRASARMSKVRYTLVVIGRMAQFAADRGKDWIDPPTLQRLASVKADAASLEQFEENLLSRVQMLQDAATAFISIEQNDVVKVLTIASVVGVPPVMVVGLYGMNFKYMPELNWHYGYAYALALIVVSTVIPLAWFKWKDWM